ncbi:MAG: serine protein kinase RIO [Candidatus Thermoplasmatota archaeon]|nr:serine protein kinase RIO [Candidatus Thermoplasmatota archaeon]
MCSDPYFLNKKQKKKLDDAIQHMIKRTGVDRKTFDEVFDRSTLLSIEKLISDRVIDYIDFPISTGKEGNVFLGITPENTEVAIKIYRISTATFKHMVDYIAGDPRFQSFHRTKRDIVFSWTLKEFKNLEKLQFHDIPCPKPIKKINNVLVMEFIGKNRQPAPLIKDVALSDPQQIFDQLILYMEKMFSKVDLIHSDFSTFNILYHNNTPVIIDLGQAVIKTHPRATEFLIRDIHTIRNNFKRYKIDMPSEETLFQTITKIDSDDAS